MWGLFAELKISFFRVAVWFCVITLFGWIFLGWWLAAHSGDLQDVAAPLTVIMMAMLGLWVPLNDGWEEKF